MINKDLLEELGVPLSLVKALGIEDCTGRGVRVAVIDSGIMDGHPHVGFREQGVRIDEEEVGGFSVRDDLTDTVGHGTACAGVIRSIAPECGITSVKILDVHLMSSSEILGQAICWAIMEGKADVINLSLGTRNEEAIQPLRGVCDKAKITGTVIVAAACDDKETDYPAAFADVIGVTSSKNGGFYVSHETPISFYAPSYPRSIPGHRKEEHFRGPSFAAARITGLVTLMVEVNQKMDVYAAVGMLSRSLRPLPSIFR